MSVQKFSVSLPLQQFKFIDSYQLSHHYKSRSDVIQAAILLLQQSQLEVCYREANREIDDAFDLTAGDGISENETW